MFARSAGVWTQQQKLTASDAAAGDQFGVSVSVSGDTAVVGAYEDDDAGDSSGSAYVFECPCPVNDDCDDMDACTQDACAAGTCSNPQRIYGDVDNNGTVSLFDLFCILDGFADEFPPPCTRSNVDIDPCDGNGTINLGDLFAVLNAFSDVDPCGCPVP